jgi:hypothetical protein
MATPARRSAKPSTPLLRVDTGSLTPSPPSHTKSGHDDSLGATNSAAFTPSPSFYIPLSPNVDRYSPSAQLARMALSQRDSAEHARDESRKLVALLFHQLSTRTRPPPIFDALNVYSVATVGAGFGHLIGAVRNVVKQKSHKRGASVLIPKSVKEDSDDEGSDSIVFSSETTFDLMVQLKELLLFSASQGWQVFEQGYVIYIPAHCILAEVHTDVLIRAQIPLVGNSLNRRRSVSAAPCEGVAPVECAQDRLHLPRKGTHRLLRFYPCVFLSFLQ